MNWLSIPDRQDALRSLLRVAVFGSLRSRWSALRPHGWTLLGALSIPLWATWPTLAVWASTVPAFEILTVSFAVGWIVLKPIERRLQARSADTTTAASDSQRIVATFACAAGLCGANTFFILATGFIPAAQAKIISYLWPIMVVGGATALGLFRLRANHAVGLAMGFLGTVILFADLTGSRSWLGVGLALLGGASWATYCVYRLYQRTTASNILANACGIAALLCLVLHLVLEPSVWPSTRSLLATIAIGIAPLALGNLAWDEGVRHGDSRLLAILAYLTPVVSTVILASVGLASITVNLVVGAVIVAGAGLFAGRS